MIRVFRAVPEILSRFMLGWIFIESGWGKLNHLGRTSEYFAILQIPLPTYLAPLVAGVEFGCGVLLILGLFTQFASGLLAIIMTVALFTAKRGEISDISTLFETSEFLYLIILLWLGIQGSQAFHFHRWIPRRFWK